MSDTLFCPAYFLHSVYFDHYVGACTFPGLLLLSRCTKSVSLALLSAIKTRVGDTDPLNCIRRRLGRKDGGFKLEE